MKCKDCNFYSKESHGIIRCRRNAPIYREGDKSGAWPMVSANDWCGEFKAEQCKCEGPWTAETIPELENEIDVLQNRIHGEEVFESAAPKKSKKPLRKAPKKGKK